MIYLIITWILSALALFITSKMIDGFVIKNFKSAMIASFVIGFLNAIIRPILLLLTLPINIITLGLFTFVVNAVVLRMAAGVMATFKIDSWKTAIIGAFVLMIVQLLINLVVF